MYRFLLSRRWLSFFALCVVVAVGCAFLSVWQWHRRTERLAANALVTSNYDRAPARLDTVLDGDALAADRTWTPVELTGEYVPAATTLVRNRPREGAAGHLVLVPFLSSGRVLLVDRGWVPTGSAGSTPESVPTPPQGTVRIVVRLRPPEPRGLQSDAPTGQAYRKRPADLATDLAARSGGRFTADAVIDGAYGQLATEDPPPAQALVPLPRPALDEGPHLSYSMQWVVFGVGALIGFVVIVRRTAAEDAGEPARPARSSRTRRVRDEDVEDALIDAQNGPDGQDGWR